jgi:hypothetical protein
LRIAQLKIRNFDRLVERTLVITPGDRSDIILGTLLADAAEILGLNGSPLFSKMKELGIRLPEYSFRY